MIATLHFQFRDLGDNYRGAENFFFLTENKVAPKGFFHFLANDLPWFFFLTL